MYHEFLQRTLVDWIALRHPVTWRMELLTFEGPGTGPEEHFMFVPDAKDEPAKVLSVEELQRIFADNRFAGVHIGVGSLAFSKSASVSGAATWSIVTHREATQEEVWRYRPFRNNRRIPEMISQYLARMLTEDERRKPNQGAVDDGHHGGAR